MRLVYTLFVIALMMLSVVSAELIDFSTYNAGDSVEGILLGGYVTITSSGDVVVLEPGNDYAVTYGAPNGPDSVKNGCLPENSWGFADIDRVHEYDFDFENPVDEFSLVMYDYGDFNPDRSRDHVVTLTGYDADDNVVATDTLDFESSTAVNPTTSDYGNLYLTGDACDAADDFSQPGLWMFNIAGDDIVRAELRFGAGIDPNIAFGLLEYEPSFTCDETTYELYAGQDIDVGYLSVVNDQDGQLTVTYHTEDGWEMTETHLDVQCVEDDVPQTKKGNPIPGHFEYVAYHDPAVTEWTETMELPADCGGALVVAAHAVVQLETTELQTVEVTHEVPYIAPFYADEVISTNQGTKKDGSPVDAVRSVPEQGLTLETSQDPSNFYSLGFGGEFVAKFTCPLTDGEGDDLRIVEDTWGTYPLEAADVYVSMDGNTWEFLGTADNTQRDPVYNIHTTTSFDLAGYEGYNYVKIVDVSDPAVHNNAGDGYDLNAIEALQDCTYTYTTQEEQEVTLVQEETAWSEGPRFVNKGNWATYSEYGVCQ